MISIVIFSYCFRVRCDDVEIDETTGEPVVLKCSYVSDEELGSEKVKGTIQWVAASSAINAEVYIQVINVPIARIIGWL